jgi:predicted AlkP superfamily pyrophosphatase or phosphodiesterase
MKRPRGLIALLVVGIGVFVFTWYLELKPDYPRGPETQVVNVILIGWDGAQRDHLMECLERNELPNLKALSEEGALVSINITTGATDTKAGWTQILTGYDPEVTGVYSNRDFSPIPEGYTIFERLENYFGDDDVVTIFIGGKRNNIRKPYEKVKKHFDVYEVGLGEASNVGSLALELLERYKDKRFFAFFHFREPDIFGHRYGENSDEYTYGMITNDEWLGIILAKLRELGLYERTYIYVTADHGFDEGKRSHRNAPYIFLATNDPRVIRNGDRKDIAPTILERFGLDLNGIHPPLNGKPLTKCFVEKCEIINTAAPLTNW